MGAMVCGNRAAYGYILESLLHFPAQRGVDAVEYAAHRRPPFLFAQGLDRAGASQAVVYVRAGQAALGALPSARRIVAEKKRLVA